ncbi:hypothetical protein FVE67_01320 [Thermosulfurimonas marina]|uniref:Flagellar hook-length control protein-like C-terminal domain-containing protein n=1 Tax=Thermosulfurimonas marina TaxID=2047767 RepID=A0A6H1WQL8_9BACT|nr:flagellar hook-length control protein FliK [Thermosulfurimonas marina]QJA05515.1 hypothetical protein FVE67_01320 [Thermosulfurimonas marina]
MRVITPAPVTYLPENLVPLFSQPGRELTVRVIEVEGKTLTLETGGERFQARLAGSLFPEAFRPGESLRVRVVSTGPPLLLHLVEGREGGRPLSRLKYLLALLPQAAAEFPSELPAVSEKEGLAPLVALLVEALKEEKREILREKSEAFHSQKDLVQFFRHLFSEGALVLPFVFADRLSWGLLEAEGQKEGRKERYFYLRLFLSELGLVEVLLQAQDQHLGLHFYFSREETLKLAREALSELRGALLERGFVPEITLEKGYYEPGVILAREG